MPNFCMQCGKEILPESRFCISCGAPVSAERDDVSQKAENAPGRKNLLLYILLPVGGVLLAAGIILLLVLTGGSKGGPGKTPQETFKNMQAALKNNDFDSLYDFVPPSQRNKEGVGRTKQELQNILNQKTEMLKSQPALQEAFNKLEGKIKSHGGDINTISDRAFFGIMMEWTLSTNEDVKKEFQRFSEATIVNTDIKESLAEIKLSSGENNPITMVRENGLWYPR